MMKTGRMLGTALLMANCVIASARSAECVNADDLSALRTAAMQQQLMVAALSCHDIGRYNHFVLSHQSELIDSDARLKAFFIRRSSEASYHTFKTELANAASLRSIRQSESFCARTSTQFDQADRQTSLAALVARQRLALGDAFRPCHSFDGDEPRMAETSPIAPSRRAEMYDDEAPAWTRDRHARRSDDGSEQGRYARGRHDDSADDENGDDN